MKIVVCIKQVPDTREVRIDPVTNNLIRSGVPSIMNPNDHDALLQALALKESSGSEVIAISMGPMQAKDTLQAALDIGADRAVLLSDKAFAGSDTLATGYTLSAVAKKLEADIVLCGAEAIDGCTGQVGPIIAEELGWPHFTYVSRLALSGKTMTVTRELQKIRETYECAYPLVACVVSSGGYAGTPTLGKEPEVWNASDVSFDPSRLGMQGSPTKVTRVEVSRKSASGFVTVDGHLPVRERIRRIVNGGIEPKDVTLIRDAPSVIAGHLLEEKTLLNRLLS